MNINKLLFDDEDIIDIVINYGINGEHPELTRREWRQEVAGQNTCLGYWEWLLMLGEDDGNTSRNSN